MIIVLTTHHLNEAEFLADQISILHFKKVYLSGKIEEIKQRFGSGFNIVVHRRDFKVLD